MNKRYIAETDLSGDTFIHDTEKDHYAWFGSVPLELTAEIADRFNLEPEHADNRGYVWVDGDYNLAPR